MGPSNAVYYNDLPELFFEFARIMLKKCDEERLIKSTLVDKHWAQIEIDEFYGSLDRKPNGNLAAINPPSAYVNSVLSFLMSHLMPNPQGFTSRALMSELSDVLVEAGILLESEVQNFKDRHRFVSLCAISVMHNTDIVLTGSETVKIHISDVGLHTDPIKIGYTNETGKISHQAATLDDGSGIFFEQTFHRPMTIFATDIPFEDAASPELRSQPGPWHFDVEVDSSGQLAPVI